MTRDETLALIRYAAALDRGIRIPDDETLALTAIAWHDALPAGLDQQQARAIVLDLHAQGQRIEPGAIWRRACQLATPLHQQGTTSLPRPVPPPARAIAAAQPLAIGAPQPVRPADVPGYQPHAPGTRHPALAVACAHCGARPGQACMFRVLGRERPASRPHPSRYEAAGLADPAHLRVARQATAGER